jgi:hypothetical protein
MKLLNLFRSKKPDDEAARRARLLHAGRITEGRILDVGTDESGTIVRIFYRYDIGGVDYESSQMLDAEQSRHAPDYAPGALVTVRYDPRQPGNSVVV